MTKELEKKYYGTDPVFVYDPTDSKNRPVPGTNHNLKIFWNVYPQYIRNMFVRAFSQDVMHKRKPRILEKEWLDVFFRLRAETGMCPNCKYEMFYTAEGVNQCFECGKNVAKPATLAFNQLSLPLYRGMKVYLWHVDSSLEDITTVVGEVIANPQNPTLLGLRNLSASNWMVTLPDASQRPLAPGSVLPIKNGFTIDFLNNNRSIATISL